MLREEKVEKRFHNVVVPGLIPTALKELACIMPSMNPNPTLSELPAQQPFPVRPQDLASGANPAMALQEHPTFP